MAFTTTIRTHLWSTGVFLAVCAIGYGARQAIGTIYSGAEATQLIDALSRAGLYLGSATVAASATVLALMLTLIGMIRRMDKDFDEETYKDVDLIARLATASMLISLLLMLAFTLPVGEFEELPQDWFIHLYNGLFTASVVLVGLVAATVTVLYRTVRRVIVGITPGDSL